MRAMRPRITHAQLGIEVEYLLLLAKLRTASLADVMS